MPGIELRTSGITPTALNFWAISQSSEKAFSNSFNKPVLQTPETQGKNRPKSLMEIFYIKYMQTEFKSTSNRLSTNIKIALLQRCKDGLKCKPCDISLDVEKASGKI